MMSRSRDATLVTTLLAIVDQLWNTSTVNRVNIVDRLAMIVQIAMSVIGTLLIKSGLMKGDRFVLFSRKEHKLVIGVVQNRSIIIKGLTWFDVTIRIHSE